jgi:D-alanyl-lipoteichoic acid acyltransferase DltB (MBOAT superfamily)
MMTALLVLAVWLGLAVVFVLWIVYMAQGSALARRARRLDRRPQRTYGCGVRGTVVPLHTDRRPRP